MKDKNQWVVDDEDRDFFESTVAELILKMPPDVGIQVFKPMFDGDPYMLVHARGFTAIKLLAVLKGVGLLVEDPPANVAKKAEA